MDYSSYHQEVIKIHFLADVNGHVNEHVNEVNTLSIVVV